MKIKKEAAIGIIILAVFVCALAGGMVYFQNKKQNDLAVQIFSMGPGGPPDTIEGLRTAIAAYEKQIEAHVRDAAQTGVYYKILAVRLQDRGLHNDALQAIQKALYYNPADPVLVYMAGLSQAILAKSYTNFTKADNAERDRLYALAESNYLTAIKLDDRYQKPRYGLGVLYVFELDRPQDAIVHLERCLEINTNDVDTMFVLARAYFMTGDYQKALDLYNRIINVTRDDSKRTEARNNRQTVMEYLGG